MEVQVSVGEWMNSLVSRMNSAVDGDCFCLPTPMHFHAFMLLKEGQFAERDFKVKVAQASDDDK
jgi:hypothetical protein